MIRPAFLGLLAMSACAFAQPPSAETLPSGVVITHVQRGSGPFPAARDTVQVHYRGTLVNGR